MAEVKRATFEAEFSVNSVSGTRDPATGVYTGTMGSLSESEIAEEQFSTARAAAPTGGFRVYRDSTDSDAVSPQFSVTAGEVLYRGQVLSYAGATNVALEGGNGVAHYIYLAIPSVTLTVATTGWPSTPHVRIATITPAAGTWSWSGFVDYRRHGVLRPIGEPAGGKRAVLDRAEAGALTAADSESTVTNLGALALSVQTLPAAEAGLGFEAVVRDADGLRLVAAAGDVIRIGGSVTPAAGYVQSTQTGASIRLRAVDGTEWVAIGAPQGAWTVSS